MRQANGKVCLALLLVLGQCNTVQAKVTPEEAARLGKDLTEVGAERAGNKDGTIPAYVGKASFAPDMLTMTHQQLEDLRVRLVKDIQKTISDPAAVADTLAQA